MNQHRIEINHDIYQALITELSTQGLTLEEWFKKHLALDAKRKVNGLRERPLGTAKGMSVMSDDFDESLKDFGEYMQ